MKWFYVDTAYTFFISRRNKYFQELLATRQDENSQDKNLLFHLTQGVFKGYTRSKRSYVTHLSRGISTSQRLFSDELFVHRDSKNNNSEIPFEFTEANMVRISALFSNYPKGAERSVVGAALDIVQRQIGWIPISAMHKVAALLSMPRMRVYEWSSFYTMNKRHFRGKFNVKVCVTTPCMLRGSDVILQAVEEATNCCKGSVSSDGMFGVDTVQCQGACVNAPLLVVDDDYYEDLDICNVHNIIQTLKCGGIPPPGPQNGRFASEPICGLTSLCEPPPPPGHGIQPSLIKRT